MKFKSEILESIFQDKEVFLVEDFLASPDSFLEAVKRESYVREKNVNYPGLVHHLSERLQQVITTRLMQVLDLADGTLPGAGRIRITNAKDVSTRNNIVHCDPNTLVLVIYLQVPFEEAESVDDGTHFYRHKKLGVRERFEIKTEKDRILQEVIISDQYIDHWEKWLTVPMKKNRAIVYDGDLFHSGPAVLRGETLDNSRITLEYWMRKDQFIS